VGANRLGRVTPVPVIRRLVVVSTHGQIRRLAHESFARAWGTDAPRPAEKRLAAVDGEAQGEARGIGDLESQLMLTWLRRWQLARYLREEGVYVQQIQSLAPSKKQVAKLQARMQTREQDRNTPRVMHTLLFKKRGK
jgi:hypothetical protein